MRMMTFKSRMLVELDVTPSQYQRLLGRGREHRSARAAMLNVLFDEDQYVTEVRMTATQLLVTVLVPEGVALGQTKSMREALVARLESALGEELGEK